jgi:hypothetical protein
MADISLLALIWSGRGAWGGRPLRAIPTLHRYTELVLPPSPTSGNDMLPKNLLSIVQKGTRNKLPVESLFLLATLFSALNAQSK